MDLNWQIISLKSRRRLARITAIILAAVLIFAGTAPSFAEKITPSAKISWEDAPPVEGTSALLMDAGSGEILFEKNAHEPRDPASVTKMLTCLVVLETMDPKQEVTVNYNVSHEGTSIDIKKGEVFTVEQLLYATMLKSANDAAIALAVAAGGSVENFCEMMNERARQCGAENTNFTNPNGLNTPGQENHRTTAYDLAMIAKEAMKNEDFREIVSTTEYTLPATNLSKARILINGNRTVSDGEVTLPSEEYALRTGSYRYEGAIGVKTGYTSVAGNCFCGYAERNGTKLIAVTLNSSSLKTRFSDVMALWDYGFEKYETYTVAKAREPLEEVRVKRGDKGEVQVGVMKDLALTLNAGYDTDEITTEIQIDADKGKKLIAPVKKGENVGTLKVYKEGDLIAKADLMALENVEEGGIFSYIGVPDEDTLLFLCGLAAIVISVMLIRKAYFKTRRRRRLRRRARRNRNMRRKEWEREKNPFDPL